MMHDDPTNVPSGLEAWLEVATRGLCDDARERIRGEISDHFYSALETAAQNGAPADGAERSALSTLGDPTEAGRSFRRTNLTRLQAALVRDHRGRPSRGVLALHVTLLALGIGVVATWAETSAQWTIGRVSLALMVVAIAVVHVLAPRSYERGRVRTAVLAGALGHWLLYCAMCVGLQFCTGADTGRYAAILYAAFLVLLLALYLPLIGKVRRLDFRRDSTP